MRVDKTERRGNVGGLLVAWVVCLPIAFFFVQLTQDAPIRSVKAVAAANDWAGERGTVTVTHRKVYSDSSGRNRHCYGEFRPANGGPTLADVRIHLRGGCQVGRVVDARVLRKDHSWLMPQKQHTAYAGTGAGEAIVVGVLMGLFCLIVGGPFVACALAFPVLALMTLAPRRGRDADAVQRSAEGG